MHPKVKGEAACWVPHSLMSACLSACLSPQLQLGVEFEASTRVPDSSVSLAYQLDVPKAHLQFKGTTPGCSRCHGYQETLGLLLLSQLQACRRAAGLMLLSRCFMVSGNRGNRLLDARGFPLLQARWTVTGWLVQRWRRSCRRCRSRWSSAPSSTTARTSSSVASASPWANWSRGPQAGGGDPSPVCWRLADPVGSLTDVCPEVM